MCPLGSICSKSRISSRCHCPLDRPKLVKIDDFWPFLASKSMDLEGFAVAKMRHFRVVLLTHHITRKESFITNSSSQHENYHSKCPISLGLFPGFWFFSRFLSFFAFFVSKMRYLPGPWTDFRQNGPKITQNRPKSAQNGPKSMISAYTYTSKTPPKTTPKMAKKCIG